MNYIIQITSELKQKPDLHSIHFYEPCKSEVIESLLRKSRAILQMNLPIDYIKFLELTDGLDMLKGNLFNGADFIEQNSRLWLCESKLEVMAGGVEIQFNEKKQRHLPTYAWLGSYGNMDSYIFDFSSQNFAVTTLGDEREVWSSYSSLADLILFLINENNEE